MTVMPVNPIRGWNALLEVERKISNGFRYTMRIAKALPRSEVAETLKCYKEGKTQCKESPEAIQKCERLLKLAKQTS